MSIPAICARLFIFKLEKFPWIHLMSLLAMVSSTDWLLQTTAVDVEPNTPSIGHVSVIE